jgi:hypothetical protein
VNGFKPVRIAGLTSPPAGALPEFRLKGFEWQIYRRAVSE